MDKNSYEIRFCELISASLAHQLTSPLNRFYTYWRPSLFKRAPTFPFEPSEPARHRWAEPSEPTCYREYSRPADRYLTISTSSAERTKILRCRSGWSVDQVKGKPFYGQAKGQLWSTRTFYAECAQWAAGPPRSRSQSRSLNSPPVQSALQTGG